jgi:hypothetical protein
MNTFHSLLNRFVDLDNFLFPKKTNADKQSKFFDPKHWNKKVIQNTQKLILTMMVSLNIVCLYFTVVLYFKDSMDYALKIIFFIHACISLFYALIYYLPKLRHGAAYTSNMQYNTINTFAAFAMAFLLPVVDSNFLRLILGVLYIGLHSRNSFLWARSIASD